MAGLNQQPLIDLSQYASRPGGITHYFAGFDVSFPLKAETISIAHCIYTESTHGRIPDWAALSRLSTYRGH